MTKVARALLTALCVLLTPAAALACPYCAGRSGGGMGQSLAIGLFVFFPFAVALVVYRIVRAGEPSASQRAAALDLEEGATSRTD